MAYTSVFKEVMRQYDRLKDESRAIRNSRVNELHEKSPRLKQIDELLNSTGARVSRAVLDGGADVKSLIYNLKSETDALNAEKKDIMNKLGYAEDYLSDVYRCKLCGDTGYVGSDKCKCLKQKLIDRYYDLSGLKNILRDENFDTFDFRFYSQTVDPQMGISPSANMHTIYSKCTYFIENFDREFSNLLFYGDTGLGKTFLCNCIAKELMDSGRTVLYVTAPRIFKKYEDYRFNKSETDGYNDQLDMVFDADLLIIDDLGSEFNTVVTASELFNIINTRILEKRATIVSSNLSINEFQSTYSDRIASRFFGNFKTLRFFGDDIRVKKRLMSLSQPKT